MVYEEIDFFIISSFKINLMKVFKDRFGGSLRIKDELHRSCHVFVVYFIV